MTHAKEKPYQSGPFEENTMTFLIYTVSFKTIQSIFLLKMLINNFLKWHHPVPAFFDGLPYPPPNFFPIK